jgi:hypothetical protein
MTLEAVPAFVGPLCLAIACVSGGWALQDIVRKTLIPRVRKRRTDRATQVELAARSLDSMVGMLNVLANNARARNQPSADQLAPEYREKYLPLIQTNYAKVKALRFQDRTIERLMEDVYDTGDIDRLRTALSQLAETMRA